MNQNFSVRHFIFNLVCLFTFLSSVAAAPGDLDTTFSQDGKAVEVVGAAVNSIDLLYGIAIQSDGKIVAVGYDAQSKVGCEVVRYNSDGSLDATFGNNGIVTVQTGLNSACAGVAVQADGKIVAVGATSSENGTVNSDFLVIRLNSNGSLDTSFDGDGRAITNILGSNEIASSVAIQADGKIVAGGQSAIWTGFSPNTEFTIVRYNPDGSLDTSFDDDGKVTTGINPISRDEISTVLIEADGKIVAVGDVRESTSDFGIVRYNPNGSLDTSFDGDGKVVIDVMGHYDYARAAAIQSDGKIVVGGIIYPNNQNSDFGLLRLNPNGSLDTSFDGDSKVTTDILGSYDRLIGVAIQPDGKIVATGSSNLPSTNGLSKLSVVRYKPNGSLDTSFDGDGKVNTDFPYNKETGGYGLLQPDGKIVVAGYTDNQNFTDTDFALARYNSNGSIDTTFDSDGKVLTNVTLIGQPSAAYAVAVQPDGKIVAAGYGKNTQNNDFAIVRYNQNGSLDTSFDSDGQVMTDFLGNADQAYAVAVQSDGKIIAAGYASNGTNQFVALARYNANGSLDASFDGDGKLTTNVLGSVSEVYGIVIQPDGKIVVAGFAYNGANSDMIIVRYNANGSLDSTFGSGGQLITSILSAEDELYAVALQPDGKIVASGSAYNGENWIPAVIRCNPNGTLDTTFDGDGKLTANFAVTRQGANGVAVQNDGKIVVVFNDGNFTQTTTLARFNPTGSFDTTFDGDGIVTTSGGIANAIAIQTDGKIAIGGSSNGESAVFRYNTDGSLDSSFGIGGKSAFDMAQGLNERIYALAIDSSSRLVGAGEAGTYFATARLLGSNSAPTVRSPYDFDGDGKSDIGIFRPSGGQWWITRSSSNQTVAAAFGSSSDKIVPADFTGDGKSDLAFFRPSTGFWYILRSEDFSFYGFNFGAAGDIPIAADFDGDGKADTAVFRPSNTGWYIQKSSGGIDSLTFGANGDSPVVADYDGDGKADIAITRINAGNREWWIKRSSDDQVVSVIFGEANDKAVQGDYTGDGKADIAFWRPSSGTWYIIRSEDFSFYGFPFGTSGDTPTPGDYDGDGKFDAAIYRSSNSGWYQLRTTQGFTAVTFGTSGDVPVHTAFVP